MLTIWLSMKRDFPMGVSFAPEVYPLTGGLTKPVPPLRHGRTRMGAHDVAGHFRTFRDTTAVALARGRSQRYECGAMLFSLAMLSTWYAPWRDRGPPSPGPMRFRAN